MGFGTQVQAQDQSSATSVDNSGNAAGTNTLNWLSDKNQARERLFDSLRRNVGNPTLPRLQTKDVLTWYFRRYYETSGGRLSYLTLVAQDMGVAWRLLKSSDLRERKIGLRIARLSCLGVGQQLRDYSLQVLIYEGMLLPNLDLASPKGNASDSRWSILEGAAHAYQKAGFTDSEMAAWRALIAMAPSIRDADSARINLAQALVKLNQIPEAIALLRKITTPDLIGAKGRLAELLNGSPSVDENSTFPVTPVAPGTTIAKVVERSGFGGVRAAPGTPFAEMPVPVFNPRLNPIPPAARNGKGRDVRLAQAVPADGTAADATARLGSGQMPGESQAIQDLLRYVEKKARRRTMLPQVTEDGLWTWYFPRYARSGLSSEEIYGLIGEDLRLAQRWIRPLRTQVPIHAPAQTDTDFGPGNEWKKTEVLRLLRYSSLWASKRLKDSELQIGLYEAWLLPQTENLSRTPTNDVLSAIVHEAAADAYVEAEKPIQAIRLLRQFLQKRPDVENARIRAQVAELLLLQSDDKAAVSLLKEIEKIAISGTSVSSTATTPKTATPTPDIPTPDTPNRPASAPIVSPKPTLLPGDANDPQNP